MKNTNNLNSGIDNVSFEQKRILRKKLRLNKETVRQLRDNDLKSIVGGRAWYTAGSGQAACCG